MTENEAKTKWCPFVRAAYGVEDRNAANSVCNRPENRIPSFSMCVGAKCMAWRETKPAEGYCGLAGKP